MPYKPWHWAAMEEAEHKEGEEHRCIKIKKSDISPLTNL